MSKKLSMYILTDTHYLSKNAWEEGRAINGREKGDQVAIKDTPEILRTFFEKIIADRETEYVLITGDLVNMGDVCSHEDLKKELKLLTDAGKKVYVTTATHDYAGEGEDGDENIFHAVHYNAEGTVPAERVGKKDLLPLYYEFGPSSASSVHETGSYSVELQKGYRLIAINDNGNGRSHCGLYEDGFNWLRNEIRKAKADNEMVFLAVHHPVIPPWPVYRAVADFELFGGYEEMRKLMCEEDVRVIFTGHSHVQGIKKYEDDCGRYFYDITTSALVGASGKMRKVIFDKDAGTCSVESIGIEKINGVDTKGLSAYEYIRGLNFGGLFEKLIPLANNNWNEFISQAEGLLNVGKLEKNKNLVKFGFRVFDKMTMNIPVLLGGKNCGLSKREKTYLKRVPFKKAVFSIVDHVFAGNAPYTPDTAEYKALNGVFIRADKIMNLIHFDINEKLPGTGSLTELCQPFLYNNRTGDDDKIIIDM